MFYKTSSLNVDIKKEQSTRAFEIAQMRIASECFRWYPTKTRCWKYEGPNQGHKWFPGLRKSKSKKIRIICNCQRNTHRGKLSSTATITVKITDINDHSPTFNQHEYASIIPETGSPGTLVTTITANDRDSGHFGTDGIIYHLEGPGAEKFSVNNRTGTVTVAECTSPGEKPCLDFETKPVYDLQFVATDDNGKGRSTSVPLRISLTDSNDNAPIFTKPFYQVFINEGAVTFEPEFVVEATDADRSSTITYSIISGNRNELFSIDPNNGRMKIHNKKGLEVATESDSVIPLTVMVSTIHLN
ncbi:hypothetical protein HHI36_013672 [Cryptolaemus montrouzieri]|uniref:Cadherin domain-containing protein n=1 Tax=Cryptolaemus montrouzieri TaxID=559131 RepID=A0ABD2NI10_9CUCU